VLDDGDAGEEIELRGDITSVEGVKKAAERLLPYDDEFYRWQFIQKFLKLHFIILNMSLIVLQ